jgi:hypothetical protein
MERIETPRGRFYQITDELIYPSVTTVLNVVGKDLTPWVLRECTAHVRKNIPRDRVLSRRELDEVLAAGMQQPADRLEEACSFGTAAHDYAAGYITTGAVPDLAALDRRMASWVSRFVRWWDASGFTCLLSEQLVWSDTYAYAGTLDALSTDPTGNLWLLDFKSSNTLLGAANYILQAVAYKMALLEQAEAILPFWAHDVASADILILRLGKRDASMDVLHVGQEDHAGYFRAFLAARALFDWTSDSERLVEKAVRSYHGLQDRRCLVGT